MEQSDTPTRYQKPHRLENVLALIQALGSTTNKTGQVNGTTLADHGLRPLGKESWAEIAKQHPEFFRVSGGAEDAIMLVCQYLARDRPTDSMLAGLMDLAVTTHDREVERLRRAGERELESHKLGLAKLSLVVSAVASIGSVVVAVIALVVKRG